MKRLVEYNAETNEYVLGDTVLSPDDAKLLIRQLIDLGVSMSFPDTSYTAGELEATKQHLNDLRKIVFEDKA